MNLSFKYTPKPECIGHKLSWPIPKRWAGPIFFKAIVKAQCNQIKLIPPSEIRKSKIKISDLSSHLLPPPLFSSRAKRRKSRTCNFDFKNLQFSWRGFRELGESKSLGLYRPYQKMGNLSESFDIEDLMSYGDDLISLLNAKNGFEVVSQSFEDLKALRFVCDDDFNQTQRSIQGQFFSIWVSRETSKDINFTVI